QKPVPSSLFATAEAQTKGLREETIWDAIPTGEARERVQVFEQLFNANEIQAFPLETPVAVVLIGAVHGAYGNLEINADKVVLWYHTEPEGGAYEIYAEGNVRIARKAGEPLPVPVELEDQRPISDVLEYMSADELYINPTLSRGLATNPEVRLKDAQAAEEIVYVVRGEEAYLIDSSTLTLSKATATTCRFARPHYRFQAETMQVVRERPSTLLSAWDVRFQTGKRARTLLWLPFAGTDLTRPAYLLSDYAIGTSDKFGFFVQTTWTPLDLTTPPDWVDTWTVNLDYYSDRGPAVGTELEYGWGKGLYPRHEGLLRAYYVRDTGSTDDTGLPVPKENRGRVHLRHRSQVSRDWRIDAEYYWLSDSQFLNEYFEVDFEEEKVPESYLLGRYLRNSTYLALLYKQQVNDFLTQVEETPSLDLEIIGLPVGGLVYDGSLVAGIYDLEFNDELAPAPLDPPDLFRVHTDHRVSFPFNAGIFRVDPFVRALATWASDSAAVGGTFQDSEGRGGIGGGVTISTTFSRAFDVVSEMFNLNRLRHIVIPYVAVEALSVGGADSMDFIQMDAIDAIDSGTEVTLGLRQRLQTKRLKGDEWRSINWAELDVALVSRSSDSVMMGRDLDYLRVDFEMALTDHISLHSRDNRIGLDDQADVVNVGASLDYMPRWALDLDYDRISNTNSTVTLDVVYQLSDRYQLALYEQYEFDSLGAGDETSLETRVVLRRILHEWVLELGVHVEEANDEVAVVFGFGPAGWGIFKDPHRAARD
ncbi:MAG: LPS-assembly protein LptD, partial [Planctomycetota bacterium]